MTIYRNFALPPHGNSDGDERHDAEPERQGERMGGGFAAEDHALDRLGVKAEAVLHEFARRALEVAQELRQAVDERAGLGKGVVDPRLGPAIGAHPFLDEGLRQRPHIDLGREVPADALGQHHRLLEQQKLRLRLHLELLRHLEELGEEAGEEGEGEIGGTKIARSLSRPLQLLKAK